MAGNQSSIISGLRAASHTEVIVSIRPEHFDLDSLGVEIEVDVVEELRRHIRAKTPDGFGVKWLNIYVAVNGEGYCLSGAPNTEAVAKSHELMGYLIETTDVIEVASLV
jgi:translation elongation factor EF-1beta